jgi:hypothetical protein
VGASAAGTTLDAPSRSGSPVLSSESELSLILDGLWDEELPCGSEAHSTDPVSHAPEELATMRGTPPCGATMNVCERFAVTIQELEGMSVSCRCGELHPASSFIFVKI